MWFDLSLGQIVKALALCDGSEYLELWNSLVSLFEHDLIPVDFWEVLCEVDEAIFNEV